MHPICAECYKHGKVTATAELDHIIPLSKGGADTDDNIQGLCLLHHAEKTAMDLGYKGKRIKPEIGVDGWPIP